MYLDSGTPFYHTGVHFLAMIKLGILGASSPLAGELIRILVNHPDVDIRFAYAPEHKGVRVAAVHHGLIGETDMTFTDTPQLSKLNAVVVCSGSDLARQIVTAPEQYPVLKVVDVSGEYPHTEETGMELGISEVNRKPLVRGATRAYIPMPTVVAAAIALYPFASSLLLNNDIDIEVQGNYRGNPESDAEAIMRYLAGVQNSFSSAVKVRPVPCDDNDENFRCGRGLSLVIKFPSTLTVLDIERLYDNIYDDHSFTFTVNVPLALREVEGTDKCLITIEKPDENTVCLRVIVDATLRGGAGDAVHILNLLFGLAERTGLALKAVNY